jgi:hypothetical protein
MQPGDSPEQASNLALRPPSRQLRPQVNTLEPLGPTVDELIELVYRVGRAAGRGRFGGLSIMATPYEAQSLHQTLTYVLLYALAGVLCTEGSEAEI